MTWTIHEFCNEKKGYIRIADERSCTVCDIFPFAGVGGVGLDLARENARKIVNADQLYDALQGLLDWCKEGCPDGGHYALTEAEAAIKSISVAYSQPQDSTP